MKSYHTGYRIAICTLAGALALTGFTLQTGAAAQSVIFPAAGIGRVLEEGTALSGVRAAVLAENPDIAAAIPWEESLQIPVEGPVAEPVSLPQSAGVAGAFEAVSDTVQDGQGSTAQYPADVPALPQGSTGAAQGSTDTTGEAVTGRDAGVQEEVRQGTGTAGGEAKTAPEDDGIPVETVPASEEEYFSSLVIARVNDYVNVRSTPGEEGEIVGKLYDKSVGEFILEDNGWYEITSGNTTGYVKAEFVVTGEEAVALAKEVGMRYATVNTTTLFVRKEASTEAEILGMVPMEEDLSVLEEMDGWAKVSVEEGEGYVSLEFVTLRTDFVKAESKAEEEARKAKEAAASKAAREAAAQKTAVRTQESVPSAKAPANVPAVSGGSDMGNAVASYGLQFVGNPYVYGGTSLTNGADCSGFVMSVYSNFGVGLPHSSSADRSQGYDVGGLENAQPGDLVCYSGHVAIYIGNGQIVHASTSKTGIVVSNANYRKVLAVRRIF